MTNEQLRQVRQDVAGCFYKSLACAQELFTFDARNRHPSTHKVSNHPATSCHPATFSPDRMRNSNSKEQYFSETSRVCAGTVQLLFKKKTCFTHIEFKNIVFLTVTVPKQTQVLLRPPGGTHRRVSWRAMRGRTKQFF